MRQSYHFEGCYSTNFNTILRNFWLHFKIFDEIDGYTRYKTKAGRGVLRQALTCGKYTTKSRVHNPAREYVPLPHVFPPSAYGRALRAGQLDAIDFVAIAIPSLRSLRLSHIRRRRLIMPLVALVQKKQSAPATAYKFWCSALPSSSPLLLAFRLRSL